MKVPRIEEAREGQIPVLTIRGDLVRDVGIEVGDTLVRVADAHAGGSLVIDLTGVDRFGSWGEDRVWAAVAAVTREGGRVALVRDPAHRPRLRGLELRLQPFSSVQAFFDSRHDAVEWLSR